MNYTKLIEDGTYKKSDLSERGQAYIEGMEYARDYTKTFLANVEDGLEDESETLAKIKVEFATSVLNGFAEWLQSEINTKIVEMSDTESAIKEAYNGTEN